MRHFTQRIVWPVVVIILHPYPYLFSYLIYVLKDIFIQDSSSIGSIEPFHKSILGRFSRLYILKLDIMHRTPIFGNMGYKFGTIVHPYLLWFSPFIDQVIEHPYNTVTGQGKIDLDMEGLPVMVVDAIKCPETPFVL